MILIPTLDYVAVISAIKKRFLDPNYLPGTWIAGMVIKPNYSISRPHSS